MANTKQAIKRVRQNAARAEVNKQHVSAMRSAIKTAYAAVEAGEENAKEAVTKAVRLIDKNVTKGHIHRNKANREKSRLHKLVNQ